jgi:signal transduction histidine kinase
MPNESGSQSGSAALSLDEHRPLWRETRPRNENASRLVRALPAPAPERAPADREKLAAVGELTAGVAHELNTPLTAILGLVELLLDDAEPDTKTLDRLLLIHETTSELKGMVRTVLDFVREPTDVAVPVALEDVLRDAIKLAELGSTAPDVRILAGFPAQRSMVNGNPNQLKQVFLNLLTNARQALPKGGTITATVNRRGNRVVATVSDNGPGIPPQILPRIFEPFYTRKAEQGGTGLGLSLSREIARRHGGDITARSEPGHGATFVLELPADSGD